MEPIQSSEAQETTSMSQNILAPGIVDNTSNTKEFVKSRKRTSFKEFVTRKHLRPEVIAGFKVWLHGNLHFFDDEWNQKFYEYTNRKI